MNYSIDLFLMCICTTSFWVEHEIGASSVSEDESLFLSFFQWCTLSKSQKRLHLTGKKKKKDPLFCSRLCKWSSTYLAFAEQPFSFLMLKRYKVRFIRVCKLVSSSSPAGLQRRDGEKEGRRSSVEEDGVGVSVGDVCHVFQYVFFSDYSQQPPVVCNQTLTEPQLPENIHSDVHRCVVGDREGAQVHDASEAEGWWSFGSLSWSMLSEDHLGSTDDALLTFSGVVY